MDGFFGFKGGMSVHDLRRISALWNRKLRYERNAHEEYMMGYFAIWVTKHHGRHLIGEVGGWITQGIGFPVCGKSTLTSIP